MPAIKCPFCTEQYVSLESTEKHMLKMHADKIPEGMYPGQIIFNIVNRYDPFKTNGTSTILRLPTAWNNTVRRYDRFANEDEKELYKKQFRERMMRVHGKEHLLGDPEVQRKMLANRKISDVFKFANGTEFTYTGTYEKDFLFFLDKVLQWDSNDLIAPAPVNISYIDPTSKKERFYIPDFFIPSLNLLIEIKSGENKHYRERDLPTEKAKDLAVHNSKYRYVKVLDKDYDEFTQVLFDLRGNFSDI